MKITGSPHAHCVFNFSKEHFIEMIDHEKYTKIKIMYEF